MSGRKSRGGGMPLLDPVEIAKFLVGKESNAWIQYGPMRVYVRKAHHVVGGVGIGEGRKAVGTFDIASVAVEEEWQSRGVFRHFVSDVEKLLEDPNLRAYMCGIYVENVFASRFQQGLENMGFARVDEVWPPSYFSWLPMPFGGSD